MLDISHHLWILAAALLLDAVIGDPLWLWRRLSHPVALAGRLIGWLDRRLNHDGDAPARRRAMGIATTLLLVLLAGGLGWGLSALLRTLPFGWVLEIVIAAVFLAQRSLHDHVAAVAAACELEGLEGGRRAVSMIVGRDPQSLDMAGVCRAAIESDAENYSDGVFAPAFWFALLGLPGILLYKAVNTADSMIGHRTARHEAFGWASARLDDVLNLAPARLCGALLALAAPFGGGRIGAAWRAMLLDAPKHRSPNAGWPEAAMAGGLGLALAGPRQYHGTVVPDSWMGGGGRSEATPRDIRRALAVTSGAGMVLFLVTVAAALLL
ncbi:adenosylcobinamide-phosphate synthase CbiB [Inquilinus sp.]|jgi:adenosylcobinamide-phosphate synthase|uniref:adenosylcobinamide-phosphate synthase CbiB n=1 Tax=Inquilinus sp. TaxID=1932117 RepID=UPI003783A042